MTIRLGELGSVAEGSFLCVTDDHRQYFERILLVFLRAEQRGAGRREENPYSRATLKQTAR